MDFKKFRKILISLLLIINAFLLFNLFYMNFKDYLVIKNQIKNNIEILSDKGINISKDMLLDDMQSYVFGFENYITEENIEVLIGKISTSENNLFVGETGTAKLSDDGKFTVVINKNMTIADVESLLINASFKLDNANKEVISNKVIYTYKLNDISVFNSFFEVILNSNSTSIDGTYIFGDIKNLNSIDFDLFDILLKIYVEHQPIGDVLAVNLEYQVSKDQKITPILKINISDKLFYYDLNTNILMK